MSNHDNDEVDKDTHNIIPLIRQVTLSGLLNWNGSCNQDMRCDKEYDIQNGRTLPNYKPVTVTWSIDQHSTINWIKTQFNKLTDRQRSRRRLIAAAGHEHALRHSRINCGRRWSQQSCWSQYTTRIGCWSPCSRALHHCVPRAFVPSCIKCWQMALEWTIITCRAVRSEILQ